MNQLFGISLLLVFIASSALAAGSHGSSLQAHKTLGADVRIYGALGIGGNQDGTNPNRYIGAGGLMLDLLARASIFRPHLVGEIRGIAQIDPPGKVFDESLAGFAYFFGAGMGIDFSPLLIDFTYEPLGSYQMNRQTITNENAYYSKPQSMTVILQYRRASGAKPFLFFNMTSYSSVTYSATGALDISSNKLNETLFGIGITYGLF